MMPARPPTIGARLGDVLRPLHERQRRSSRRRAPARTRGRARSFVGQRRDRQHDVRHVDALAVRQRRRRRPPSVSAKSCAAASRRAAAACRRRAAASAPGSSAAKISGCGRRTRSRRRASGRGRAGTAGPSAAATRPSANVPTRSFGPCRSASMPIGRPASLLDRADQRRARAVVLVRAVAEIEPEHIGAGVEQRRMRSGVELAGPSVATILAREKERLGMICDAPAGGQLGRLTICLGCRRWPVGVRVVLGAAELVGDLVPGGGGGVEGGLGGLAAAQGGGELGVEGGPVGLGAADAQIGQHGGGGEGLLEGCQVVLEVGAVPAGLEIVGEARLALGLQHLEAEARIDPGPAMLHRPQGERA